MIWWIGVCVVSFLAGYVLNEPVEAWLARRRGFTRYVSHRRRVSRPVDPPHSDGPGEAGL